MAKRKLVQYGIVVAFDKYHIDFIKNNIAKGDHVLVAGSLDELKYVNKEGISSKYLQINVSYSGKIVHVKHASKTVSVGVTDVSKKDTSLDDDIPF